MDKAIKYEIGIVDTRKVVQVIWDNYGFNLKDFALTSLKRRLEHIMYVFNLSDTDELINRLKKDHQFFDDFISEFVVEVTELFRDTSLWRTLRDTIIPELVNSSGSAKFFVPLISSGEELYSLSILLRESQFEKNCQIIASAFSETIIERVKLGTFNPKKLEISEANYNKFSGKFDFRKYYNCSNNFTNWDKSLIENVQFVLQNPDFEEIPKGLRLVLFRNELIYFNQSLVDRALLALHQNILAGGYLVIGNKEKINTGSPGYYFQEVDKGEKIYRRK